MRHHPTTDSSSQLSLRSPSEKARLHPTLSSALANLDIQLEEELARYRRQRFNSERPQRQPGRKPSAKSLDLISIAATGSKAAPHAGPASETVAENGLDISQGNASTVSSGASSGLVVATQAGDNANLMASAALAEEALTEPPNKAKLDDYLESSEELLRSLAEEEARVRAERGFMQNLLTPLGIGSLLLLLLSSAMFGYVVMNPASLSQLFAAKDSANSPTSTASGTNAATDTPEPNLATQEFKDLNLDTLGTLKANRGSAPGARPAPANPSPSARSGNLGTMGTTATSTVPKAGQLDRQNSAESQVAPPSSPVTTMRTYSPPEPALPARSTEAPRSTAPAKTESAPAAPAAANQPSVAPVPAAPASSPTATPSNNAAAESYRYKVVTPYDGDRTLEAVKQTVPDAFIRNSDSGANIQVGAYKDEAAAAAQVQKLQEQGISAEVKKP